MPGRLVAVDAVTEIVEAFAHRERLTGAQTSTFSFQRVSARETLAFRAPAMVWRSRLLTRG